MTQFPTNPTENLAALIRCASVTPKDDGALDTLADMLEPMGFDCEHVTFTQDGTPDIGNLYARRSGNGPHLMFAGHTDVVPIGDESAWAHPPFAAEIHDGVLFGRGAVDMKGGIACFVAALARVLKEGSIPGNVSFLITGDEEGPAINGSVKLLEWAATKGEKWDACILGEPTNPETIGDMVKIGRRGSLSGTITVQGTQGHVAYPHLADNPVRSLIALCDALLDPALDEGNEAFQATNLEVTSIDTGNPAVNVIAAKASAAFNVRFNDHWSEPTLRNEILSRLNKAAADTRLRKGKDAPIEFDVVWKEPVSQVFLTRDDALIETISSSIETVLGKTPELSTSGGTSDARYIKDYCPVVEFGLVGQTMHMVDERVPVADLETLTSVYEHFIRNWFQTTQA
ncbi:MAG: succinyl-diaminopimelate desuccinylase [Pseudomonadota bacterium]